MANLLGPDASDFHKQRGDEMQNQIDAYYADPQNAARLPQPGESTHDYGVRAQAEYHAQNRVDDIVKNHDKQVQARNDAMIRNQALRAQGLPAEKLPVVQNPLAKGGAANASGNGKVHQAVNYIREQNPDLSHHEALALFRKFRFEQKHPGLADFVKSNSGAVDPNHVQAFFKQTVQPYIQNIADKYNAGNNAGYAAMQNILSSTAMPQAEKAVMSANLPLEQAGNQMYGAALEAGARTQPSYDMLLQQLQDSAALQREALFNQSKGSSSSSSGGSSFADLVKLANG